MNSPISGPYSNTTVGWPLVRVGRDLSSALSMTTNMQVQELTLTLTSSTVSGVVSAEIHCKLSE